MTSFDQFQLFRCLGCSVIFREGDEPDASSEQPELNQEENKHVWSEYERIYHADRSRTFARVLSNLPSGEGRTLLDVGSALGWFMEAAGERGYETSGVEPEREVAELGRERTRRPIFVGRFEESDYEPQSFDVVTMFDVLEHVVDPTLFLARTRAVLRPGGHLVVRVPDLNGLLPRVVHLADNASHHRISKGIRLLWQAHRWGFNRRSLELLFAASGFTIVNQYGEHANEVSTVKQKSWASNKPLVWSVSGMIRLAGALRLHDERVVIARVSPDAR